MSMYEYTLRNVGSIHASSAEQVEVTLRDLLKNLEPWIGREDWEIEVVKASAD